MKLQVRSAVKTVTTAGTRVALATTDTWAIGLSMLAPAANAGVVYFGDVTVAAANGRQVSAGGALNFADLVGKGYADAKINLKNCYVDAATNGDKMTLCWFEEVL